MHRAQGEPCVLAFRSIMLLAAAALAQLRLMHLSLQGRSSEMPPA